MDKKHIQPGRVAQELRRTFTAFLWTAFLAISPAWAGSKVRFNLAADEFPRAIIEFYHQSKIEVIYSTVESLRSIRTQAVVGEFEPREALVEMLKGTPLTFVFVSDHSVVIKRIQTASAPPPKTEPAAAAVSHAHAATEPMVSGDSVTLAEVVVTGSLIHGVLDVIAPLVYVTRKELTQASYATVQDALYSLPVTSLNAPREDLIGGNNYSWGAGINLRGLGVGATLVLVNGRRQPLSGVNGDYVDVSNIPWSAVERIEVLPDGASALYGSDAIAGVVNIILRDDVQRAETQTRLGGATGGRDEGLVSQLVGTHWENGKAMLVYQYSRATSLAAADRAYAADADKRPLGGSNYRSYYSNPANILSPSTFQPTYGIPRGQNGAYLDSASLSSAINLENQFAEYQLFPKRETHNLYATLSQTLNEHMELFAEGRFALRGTLKRGNPQQQVLAVPRTNPFFVDPFGGSPYVLAAYSFLQDLGPIIYATETQNYMGTVGAKVRLGAHWRVSLSESYGRETTLENIDNVPDRAALNTALADSEPSTAFNPFGDGSYTNRATLEAIRRNYPVHVASSIETTSVLADGPLVELPAGTAKLAIGLERRQEVLRHDVPDPTNPLEQSISERYSRNATSAFGELLFPLIGNPNDPRAIPRLELILAGRFEEYSDFGHPFNPTSRIRWVPWRSIKLRASWGRSFRAPKLDDLYDSSQNAAGLALLPDSQSPTGRSLVLAYQGNNPNLRQETATTWTAGVDWVPLRVPNLNVSLTYYEIDYRDRISQPGFGDPFNILMNENEWASVITRNPTPTQIAAVCNSPDLIGARSDCLNSSPAAIVDFRLANLATTKTSGIDLDASRSLDSRFGHFRLGLNGSYVFRFDQAVTSTSPSQDILNTVGNPLTLQVRGTADWSQHGPDLSGLGLRSTVNYTGGYRNPASALIPTVDPWTTLDFQLRYHTRRGQDTWANMEFVLNAVNVLDRAPSFVDGIYGYDHFNVQPLGRVVSFYAKKNW